MPPRRSTRSSTADITPEPTKTRQANRASTKTIVPKKEPSEPDSSEEVEEEEEEPVKAKRKPANGAANKGRTSTASTSSRPSRSRSSKPTVRRVAEDDSSDEEEKENEEEEGEEEAPPRKSAPRSTRGKSAAPLSASSQTNGRTQKARGKKTVVSPSPEASDREVTPAPVTRQGEALSDSDGGTPVTTAKATKAGKKRVVDSDSDADETVEDNEVEEELLAVKVEDGDTEQSASPPAKKRTPATDASTDEEDEDDLMATKPASVRPRPSLVMPPPQPAEPEDTGPKPRLVIHKMALVNFKSYKGRQEIGPFHKSFSSIVGPNGSGKSNTIDALLFVFGYRASKMRQGKLSELIHNSRGDQDEGESFCSVEVHFREIFDLPGPDAFEVVEGSQLVVARTAYKNNSSKYTINGNPSNFTEVTTLLKDRGIDLDHKRFLILQGEVESIAQMKPKAPTEHEDGLLEYLEDIIGTSKYKEPIEECAVEVEKLNEERGHKLGRLKIVEREKGSLEEKKKEAEDYLRDMNDLVRAQSVLAQHWIWQALGNAEINEKTIERLKKQLADEQEKNKDTIADSEKLQADYDERIKVYEEVRKEVDKLSKTLASHEKEEVKFQEKKKHAVTKQKKIKKSLSEDAHAKSEAEASIENCGDLIEKTRDELEGLEKDLEKAESELEVIRDSLKDKTEVFHVQIEAKQKELEPWTAKINKKQAEIDLAESERALLAEKAQSGKTAVDEATEALEKLREDKAAKAQELKDLKEQKKALDKEAETRGKKYKTMQEQGEKLREKASSSRHKAEEAKASQTANTSQNAVLDTLNRLKASGRIHGFHGRLGSLGTIPDKYDVAISTACPALNNLVVDTVDQGQACIEYLRKQSVGRASFIVLDKLPQDGKAFAKIDTPENVPRLFDLVKPKDPRFAPAFFKGLGNTLVADTLEQANKIAYGGQKRWRVVTLAGQLIDTSGTMSGGGTKVAKGGMSSKLASDAVGPEVVKQYEKESAEIEKELEEFMEAKREYEKEMEGVLKKIPEVEMAIEKVELDISTAEKRMTEAEKRVKQLQAQSKPDANDVKRISVLESEIKASQTEVEKLRLKSSAIESDIQSLQEKILEIGGVRLRSQKAKVDGLKQLIDLASDKITKAEVGKAKAEKDSEKYEKAMLAGKKALEELDGELEELEGDLDACKSDLNAIRDQVQKGQDAVDAAKDELAEMKAELDDKMVLINEFRAVEMEIKQKLEDAVKTQKEIQKTMDHWRDVHDKLELHDVDPEDDEEGDETKAAEPQEEPQEGEEGEEAPSSPAKKEKAKRREHDSDELRTYTADELKHMKRDALTAEVALLQSKVKDAKPNLDVLAEYRKREAEFLNRAKDLEKITALRDAQKNRFDELRKTRLDEFMSGFNMISSKLKEMYQMITLGGNAELELVDSLDPFSEGIIFSVMPPKKSWKNISNLSGGEKTLSSLALVFALHVFKPTPLYFMDEIDAALDFRNVSIVANYIKDRTKNAQFIIISLRNDMFELSHRLIGIYKTANATRSISIDNTPLSAVHARA